MKRILVLDDEPDTCELIRFVFRRDSLDIITSIDTRDALHILKTEPIDLLLLDVVLPDFNGIDLCHLIAKDMGFDTLPIILMSAHINLPPFDIRINGRDLPSAFLSKPFSIDELRQAVTGVLAENTTAA